MWNHDLKQLFFVMIHYFKKWKMFSELEDEIRIRLHDKEDELNSELINEIDPEIPTKYNSVNVFLGRAGSGKSFNILQIFAKISKVCQRTHVILYINKTGQANDKTFSEIFEDLIDIPIVFCSYNNAVPTFDKIRRYKELYQQIKEKHLENRIHPDQKKDILKNLYINDFSPDWLHTIVYFEDAHKNPLIYGKKDLYFISQLPLFRHDKVSYYFSLQVFTGFPTDIKTQITHLFLFPGYSQRQFKFIVGNLNVRKDINSLLQKYKNLTKYGFLKIDNEQGNIEVF